jgi:hypothetical protein
VENLKKSAVVVPADDSNERRSSRLIEGLSIVDSFAGWGPRMASSARITLRGLN